MSDNKTQRVRFAEFQAAIIIPGTRILGITTINLDKYKEMQLEDVRINGQILEFHCKNGVVGGTPMANVKSFIYAPVEEDKKTKK